MTNIKPDMNTYEVLEQIYVEATLKDKSFEGTRDGISLAIKFLNVQGDREAHKEIWTKGLITISTAAAMYLANCPLEAREDMVKTFIANTISRAKALEQELDAIYKEAEKLNQAIDLTGVLH